MPAGIEQPSVVRVPFIAVMCDGLAARMSDANKKRSCVWNLGISVCCTHPQDQKEEDWSLLSFVGTM
jgi:hypothetical protein